MVQTATMDEAGLRASASTVHVYQDENCSSGSFSVMTQAFSQRISELQQLVSFRVEDSVKHIFMRDIQGIEASVKALEQAFESLRQRTQQELSALPKARALLQAAQIQQQHLQHISNNLPQHLPNLLDQGMQAAAPSNAIAYQSSNSSAILGVRCPGSAPVPPGIAIAKDDSRGAAGSKVVDRRRKDASAAALTGPVVTSATAAAVMATAPRWYITAGELSSTPSYMRGRLTLDKVNAALDELAGHAEACHRQMAAVGRNQLSRVALSAEDRQRLHDMYHHIEMKDAARGRFWFLETELKAGTAVRMDKTGKSILMLLRHLGRLQEVRGILESLGSVTAFIFQQP